MSRQTTCSNCGQEAPFAQMLMVLDNSRTVAKICPECQRAKKIKITLCKNSQNEWEYYQYSPVEP